MKLHELKPNEGAVKKRKRLGRGPSSGKGGTSTRGHKGQQSRSGYSFKWGHEGGQMPIQMRLPKRGFKNVNAVSYKIFNVGVIKQLMEAYKMENFSIETLYLNNIISRVDKVKILGSGKLENFKTKVQVHAVSKKAKELLEKSGCTVEVLGTLKNTDK